MRRVLAVLSVLFWAGHTAAWAEGPLAARSDILVIEFDRVVNESLLGRQILAELEQARAALVTENERIETELTEEERVLTEQRATLAADEFRALAQAFDTKVTALRSAQDDKARALSQEVEKRRQVFFQAVQPILQSIMQDAQASVMIERGTTLMVRDGALITDLAIARINAEMGADQ